MLRCIKQLLDEVYCSLMELMEEWPAWSPLECCLWVSEVVMLDPSDTTVLEVQPLCHMLHGHLAFIQQVPDFGQLILPHLLLPPVVYNSSASELIVCFTILLLSISIAMHHSLHVVMVHSVGQLV